MNILDYTGYGKVSKLDVLCQVFWATMATPRELIFLRTFTTLALINFVGAKISKTVATDVATHEGHLGLSGEQKFT